METYPERISHEPHISHHTTKAHNPKEIPFRIRRPPVGVSLAKTPSA
jgi:hypothetical protein